MLGAEVEQELAPFSAHVFSSAREVLLTSAQDLALVDHEPFMQTTLGNGLTSLGNGCGQISVALEIRAA